jgi:predicted ATPase
MKKARGSHSRHSSDSTSTSAASAVSSSSYSYQPPIDTRHIKFCGRQNELDLLSNALEECIDRKYQRGVFIEGNSGIGKTALVDEFVKTKVEKMGILCCRGKFDEDSTRTFSGLSDCYEQLVEAMIKEDAVEWRRRILDDHAVDYTVLFPLVSNLEKLLVPSSTTSVLGENQQKQPQNDKSSASSTRRSDSRAHLDKSSIEISQAGRMSQRTNDMKNSNLRRMILAFAGLTRLWTTSSNNENRPLVFVLDDAQWVNKYMMQLLRKMTFMSAPKHCLVIATFRSIPPDHFLRQMMQEAGRSSWILHVPLTPLDVPTTGLIISNALRKGPDDVKELAAVMHQKTGGNPFIVCEFLTYLASRRLLSYSINSYAWTWDVKEIAEHSDVTEGIADLVVQNLGALNAKTKEVLVRTAALGPTNFRGSVVFATILGQIDGINNVDDVLPCLNEAMEKGFIEHYPKSNVGKFCHNKVKETLVSLLPSGDEMLKMHLHIGTTIIRCISSETEFLMYGEMDDRDELLMLAMSHVDRALSIARLLPDKERLSLVEYNEEAAEIVVAMGNYALAIRFLEASLDLLTEHEQWTGEFYALTLRLSNSLANVYCASGERKKCEDLVVLIGQKARCLEDCLPSIHPHILLKMQNRDIAGAVDLCKSTIQRLSGLRFPQRCIRLVATRRLSMITKKMRRMTDDEIMNLPDARDSAIHHTIEALNDLATIASIAQLPELLQLSVMASVWLTLNHGFCDGSNVGMAGVAAHFSRMSRLDEAHRLGTLAVGLGQRSSVRNRARGDATASTLSLHWKTPLHKCLSPCLETA